MKKLIFLLIFLPFVAVSQTNLNQSAEEFVKSYFKMFEDKKWDDILLAYSDDAQIVFTNGSVVPYSQFMKNLVENNKKVMSGDKIDIKWILSDVLGTDAAMVTVNFLETTDRSGNTRMTDNINVFLLEKKEGTWKIKKWIPQNNYPLIFSENIDKKLQTGKLWLLQRFEGAMGQMWNLLLYNLESSTKNGTTPSELGKMMGVRFAKTWDQSKGFEGLVSSMVWNLQTMSRYVEVLVRNETTFKAKFILPEVSKTWNVSKDDMLAFTNSCWGEIADYMEGTCSVVDDGKYCLLTLSKK